MLPSLQGDTSTSAVIFDLSVYQITKNAGNITWQLVNDPLTNGVTLGVSTGVLTVAQGIVLNAVPLLVLVSGPTGSYTVSRGITVTTFAINWLANVAPVAYASSNMGSVAGTFNTNERLDGDYTVAWMSVNDMGESQRIFVDLGTSTPIDAIRVVNFNHLSTYPVYGVQLAKIYVQDTNPSTVWGTNVTDTQKVYDGVIPIYPDFGNGQIYAILTLTQSISGRYVIIDASRGWGYPNQPYARLGLRRVQMGQFL